MVVLIMGPTAAGKTTIGRLLAKQLRWTFLDADDFHSPESKAKMHAGIPLADDDRMPWLRAIHSALAERSNTADVVLACSALKQSYREILSEGLQVKVVYLKASQQALQARIEARTSHFASTGILPGQFADLEEPGDALTADAMQPRQQIVAQIVRKLQLKPNKE
jgi:carbohydrate kinase (thermoresistant glucokinase family)